MYEFNDYLKNKDELAKKMSSTKAKILELAKFGIDITEPIQKIDNAINILSGEKISVVLVGAFSDGKTSVAAGWLNEKMSDMKIDSDESSDEILCYVPSSIPEGCQIVDTPGLFGDKVGADEDGNRIALSDITRKYISEANLILYVVTAKNPIKDSHKECIRWILKDLNKLTSTVFVINRMDDVADLTDDDDFNTQAKIKTENLRGKLIDCGLSESEAAQVRVACVSAAPDGKGIEVWNGYRGEYLRRSHLSVLENTINEILKDSGNDLIVKTGCDILNDEINKLFDAIQFDEEQIEKNMLPEAKESYRRNKNDLDKLKKRIIQDRSDMNKELNNLLKQKRNAIRAASMEDFKDVMEDEIGILKDKEGYVLEDGINDILNKYATKFSGWTMELGEKFQAEYDKQNKAVSSFMKSATGSVANGLKSASFIGVNGFKTAIFAGRDLLKNIGVAIKFKPWQVTKMASFATKALPAIGAAIDVTSVIVENITATRHNKEFKEAKENITTEITSVFYELQDKMKTEDSFIDQFAPHYRTLEMQLKQDEKDIDTLKDTLNNYQLWRKSFSLNDIKIV